MIVFLEKIANKIGKYFSLRKESLLFFSGLLLINVFFFLLAITYTNFVFVFKILFVMMALNLWWYGYLRLSLYRGKMEKKLLQQRFIHDIRKPLSMFEALLEIIKRKDVNSQSFDFISKYVPQIDFVVKQASMNIVRNSECEAQEESDFARSANEKEVKIWLKNRKDPLRVLLVDDEEIYSSVLCLHFRSISNNIEVNFAKNSDESLLAVNEFLDVVILDLDLGKNSKDGFYILKKIKSSFPEIKVFIHSNHLTPFIQKKASELGADLFLPKPASAKLLAELVFLEFCSQRSGI